MRPDWWHSPDAEATEDEVSELVAALVRALQPEVVIETGTYDADTAVRIAKALRKNGHGRLWTFETDPLRFKGARTRLAPYLRNEATIVNSTLQDYIDSTPLEGAVNFAFFDSALGAREGEFRALYDPLLRGHAIVAFHDAAPQHLAVVYAVERLALEGVLRPIFLPTPRGIALAEVT